MSVEVDIFLGCTFRYEMTRFRNDLFLYFDLGNVIALFDHELIVRNLAGLSDVSDSEIRQSVFESDLLLDYERGTVTTTEFYNNYCSATGCSAAESDVVFAASNIFRINASIIPLVSHLKQVGYRLGILSNTCEAHWKFLLQRYCILDKFFDVHALSYRLNALKPESEIYVKAGELAGIDAENIFFVDDRAEHVDGARRAGWNAEVYKSTAKLSEQLAELGVVCNY